MRAANRQTKSKDPVHPAASTGGATNSYSNASTISTLLIFVLFLPIGAFGQAAARFPGKKPELISPDRHWVLQNIDRDEPPQHSVFLKNKATGESRKVRDYERGVSVIWSPDSRHFVLNNYAGSDFTETNIFSVDDSAKVDVQEAILNFDKSLGERVRSTGWDHDYFAVVRWLDNHEVVVHHWGHAVDAKPQAFCVCYIYTLSGQARRCSHQPIDDNVCEALTP